MNKRIAFVLLLVLIGLIPVFRLSSAQNAGGSTIISQASIDQIFQKLDIISKQLSIDSEKDVIIAKLDKILANQEQIKQELDVVKIRATRK